MTAGGGPIAAARPLAILAGGGRFPTLVARAVEAGGRPTLVIGIEGEADLAAERRPDAFVRRGQLGRLLQALRRADARDLVLIGAIRDRRMPRLSEIDATGLWTVLRHRRLLEAGDDGVLRILATLLERHGCHVVGAGEVAPALLAPAGPIGRLAAPSRLAADLGLGLAAARALGRRDAGQGVVVAEGRVLAEEGRDGTDAMLSRLAAAPPPAGAGILLKCLKPGQDRRLDLPAIGPDTIAAAARAGLAGIAVEAGATLIADREATAAAADAAGLFVAGLVPGGLLDPVAAASAPVAAR